MPVIRPIGQRCEFGVILESLLLVGFSPPHVLNAYAPHKPPLLAPSHFECYPCPATGLGQKAEEFMHATALQLLTAGETAPQLEKQHRRVRSQPRGPSERLLGGTQ